MEHLGGQSYCGGSSPRGMEWCASAVVARAEALLLVMRLSYLSYGKVWAHHGRNPGGVIFLYVIWAGIPP